MSFTPFSANDYAQALLNLLPQGDAWPKYPGSNLYDILQPLSTTYNRTDQSAIGLVVDAFPATTVELLEEWEASLNLPDPCQGASATLAARQAQVVARFSNTGSVTRFFFEKFCEDLGFAVTIREYTASVANGCVAGAAVSSLDYGVNFQWTITYFSFGFSPSEVLICELENLKPDYTQLALISTNSTGQAPVVI